MSLDLINISPTEILDLLKSAYYDQTGETIQIGSDAFATSAVQSYVWSVLLNNINENTRNRFIDTATGSFLDAIASNYGITERPQGYHATARFAIEVISMGSFTIPANALIIQDDQGNQFTNLYPIAVSPGTNSPVLYAVEAGTKYNGIPHDKINIISEGTAYISSATNQTMTQGGTDGFPYTEEGDDAYREWLKTQIQSYAGAGTYQAYEARARNADPRVLDVYVLRQEDTGYQKGRVNIFIYSDPETDSQGTVLDVVRNSCSDPSFRPIGDLVVVQYSPMTHVDINRDILVSYPGKFQAIAPTRNQRILAEYKAILAQTINKPFAFEELCAMLVARDADGVYALDAKPLAIGSAAFPLPVYPQIGGRLSPDKVFLQNKYKL